MSIPPRIIILIVVFALLFTIGFGVSLLRPPHVDEQGELLQRWPLPAALSEASGLAVLNADTLLTHDDERARVYRLSLPDRTVTTLLTIGQPPIADDFEGIALTPYGLFLTNSKGVLYHVREFDPSSRRQRQSATRIDTGLSKICEIEGLHFDNGELLMPCKTPLTDQHAGKLVVFAWHLQGETLSERISIPKAQLDNKTLRPTAIDVRDRSYYLLASRKLVVIAPDLSIRMFNLPRERHPQPEGLSLLDDGSIIVVEDVKNGRSVLTRYSGLEDLQPTER